MVPWRKPRKIQAVLLCSFLLSVATSFAQGNVGRKSPTPQVQTEQAFDLNVTKLPLNYRGNDPLTILRALESSESLKDKSEFETTDAYNSRIDQFPSSHLVGQLSGSSSLAFEYGPKRCQTDFSSVYDADDGILKIEFNTGNIVNKGNESDTTIFTLRSNSAHTGGYIGENAFGATKQVYIYKGLEVELAPTPDGCLLRKTHNSDSSDGYYNAVRIPMSPTEARLLKERVRLLIIGTLVDPFYDEYQTDREATFENDFENHTLHKVIFLHATSLWAYDASTGDILAKINCSPQDEHPPILKINP